MLFDLIMALIFAGSPVATYGGGVLLAEHNAHYTMPKGNLSTAPEDDRDTVWRWGPSVPTPTYPDMKADPGKHFPNTGSSGRFERD